MTNPDNVIANFPEEHRNSLLLQYASTDETFQQEVNALLKSFILRDPNPLLKYSAEHEFENKSKKTLLEFVKKVRSDDFASDLYRAKSSHFHR